MPNDFKDLKGLPPKVIPKDKKEIPKELKPVNNNHSAKPTALNFSDYWNMFFAILSDYALSKLDASSQNKVLSFRQILAIILIVIILIALGYLIL